MKEKLIDPLIYYGPGSCSVCLTPLRLADRETYFAILDSEGEPHNTYSMNICMATCPKCGIIIEMERHGTGYRPISEARTMEERIMTAAEHKDYLEKHEVKKFNPFIYREDERK